MKEYTLYLLDRHKRHIVCTERLVHLEPFSPSNLIEFKLKFLLWLRGVVSWRSYFSNDKLFNVLRIRRENRTIGYVFSFMPTEQRVALYSPSIEVSIAIDPLHRGHGLGVAAIECLIAYFSDVEDKFNIIALVGTDNVISNRLFRRFSTEKVLVKKRTGILTAYLAK